MDRHRRDGVLGRGQNQQGVASEGAGVRGKM